jgi:hypothetical protein
MNGMEKRVRPLGVTILALVVLYVSATNLLRLVQSITLWDYLTGLLSFSPAYLALSGLVWGVAFLWLAWGLWRGLSYAPRLAIWVFLFYSIYYWVDRLLLPGPTTRNTNWVFSLIIHISMLLYIAWLLTRRKSRRYFGESYE